MITQEQARWVESRMLAVVSFLIENNLTTPEEFAKRVAQCETKVDQDHAKVLDEWRAANPEQAKGLDFLQTLMGG